MTKFKTLLVASLLICQGLPAIATGMEEVWQDSLFQFQLALTDKHYDRAMLIIDSFIKKYPGFADAYYQKSVAQFKAAKYEDALVTSNSTLICSNIDPKYYFLRAQTYDKLRQPWLAINDYKTALSLDPRRSSTYAKLINDDMQTLRQVSAVAPSSPSISQTSGAVHQTGVWSSDLGGTAKSSLLSPAVYNYDFYVSHNPDLRTFSREVAAKHWLDCGVREGRVACATFSVTYYIKNYADVPKNHEDAMRDWILRGRNLGRRGI